MKSDLAIATLIRSRMTELGLSRGELAKQLGYKNIAKGIRRIDALCDGDLEGTKQFLDVLRFNERMPLISPAWVRGSPAPRNWNCQNPSKAAISASTRPSSGGCRLRR